MQATSPIQALIDQPAGFEIVADNIAQILANESVSQQALAAAAGSDPLLWELRVFKDRARAWEIGLNNISPENLTPPIVNVWFDNSNFEKSMGNVVKRQQPTSLVNIDVYGYGLAKDDPNSAGHFAGDERAANTAHRGTRLVTQILMAANYTYLLLRGMVGQRWIQNLTSFQPQIDSRQALTVWAVRVTLAVSHNELRPQIEATDTLSCIHLDLEQGETGEVLAQLHLGSECGAP